MRRINVTAGEAKALLRACDSHGYRSPGDLLDKATDGDENALEALREAWPRPTRAENAWRRIAQLSAELRERLAARPPADLAEAARIQSKLDRLRARYPERPKRVRGSEFATPDNTIDYLLELAAGAPRIGAGRPSVADGIRVLLEGVEDA